MQSISYNKPHQYFIVVGRHLRECCCWLATLEWLGFEGDTIISSHQSNSSLGVVVCKYWIETMLADDVPHSKLVACTHFRLLNWLRPLAAANGNWCRLPRLCLFEFFFRICIFLLLYAHIFETQCNGNGRSWSMQHKLTRLHMHNATIRARTHSWTTQWCVYLCVFVFVCAVSVCVKHTLHGELTSLSIPKRRSVLCYIDDLCLVSWICVTSLLSTILWHNQLPIQFTTNTQHFTILLASYIHRKCFWLLSSTVSFVIVIVVAMFIIHFECSFLYFFFMDTFTGHFYTGSVRRNVYKIRIRIYKQIILEAHTFEW